MLIKDPQQKKLWKKSNILEFEKNKIALFLESKICFKLKITFK